MTEKPFQGLATFLKSPVSDLSAKMAVVGLPFDSATSFHPGARFGPNAIRAASMMLTDGEHPLFETDPRLVMTDLGDVALSSNTERALAELEEAVSGNSFVRAAKPVFFMGGDHTVTLGVLRGLSKAGRLEDAALVHFDAHCDTWEDHFGEPVGHGTWVRNAIDEKLIAANHVMQIGIRSPVDRKTRDWLPRLGGRVISARQALRADLVTKIRYMTDGRPVYISFDIDALDPAYAPGTGTPEIAGLMPHLVLDVLEGIAHHVDLVGMDVVETNPMLDPTKITALTAATLMWTVAAGQVRRKSI